ncbi:MAG: hypothetical protein WEB30_08955 [Cyclobacteriaceae bacterium]
MHGFIFILAFLFLQELPFKSKDEFEIKLDYQFKQRPLPDHNTVHLGKDYERNPGVLPYLVLDIKLLKLPSEKMRVRIINNLNARAISRKVDLNSPVGLDLGFTDDMKDRVTAHRYTLTFITQDKTPVEIIVINVDEDGSFFVNGEKRGKF